MSYLILILPDDSHAYIPVSWTNLQTETDKTEKGDSISHLIAHCRDLVRAQVVVHSLLRKMSSEQTAIKTQKENDNDNGTDDLVGTGANGRISCQSDLGTTRSCCQKRYGHTVVTIDGQGREHKPNAQYTGEQS